MSKEDLEKLARQCEMLASGDYKPSDNLRERFEHEETLRSFFNRLAEAGILTKNDFSQHTKDEILNIAMPDGRQQRVLNFYLRKGDIAFKPG